MKVSPVLSRLQEASVIDRLGRLWQDGHSLVMLSCQAAASRAGSDMTTEAFHVCVR